jgi:hypothetical protein
MVLELASLIVATISAIINGAPIFAKLWTKLKSLFGSRKSENFTAQMNPQRLRLFQNIGFALQASTHSKRPCVLSSCRILSSEEKRNSSTSTGLVR